jgi:hypothetical protein
MRRDLRRYAETTTFRLIIGGVLLTFTIGIILIGIFYGVNSAIFGLICLASAFIPIGLIILAIFVIGRYVEDQRKKQE